MQLSAFKTYVKRDFKRTDKDTELVQAYNDMIVWVAAQMPHGNYKFQSYVPTVIGQEDYPIPSNAIHLIHPVRLLLGTGSSDSGYSMDYLTKEEYDLREPNPNRTSPASKGRPSAYTVFSRSILTTPIPDLATYLLEINWSKRPTAQSADADISSLGAEWDEVLKHGTLERLYEGLGMLSEAAYWGAKYKDAEGVPVGLCRSLFEIERDREEPLIGVVEPNWL